MERKREHVMLYAKLSAAATALLVSQTRRIVMLKNAVTTMIA
jgi:hypothetical protein